MESTCIKRLCTNERFVFRQDADCWRSELVHSVGRDVLKVFSGTPVLKDLSLLKDFKPASVSNWSYDENCLFCCLRREKVKEHVVAHNKKIVESGGKPLLGKDPSNIRRLERQSEEYLNAVLHRTEYKPRIPDPHIPRVACGVMQQMIGELATYYTSRNNCSQDPLQNNDEQDQSPLKTSCSASPAAADMTSTRKQFIMVDQDAPLDLSVKKIKVEDDEQDGVLDLSTKKSFNQAHSSLRNSHIHVSATPHLVARDSCSSLSQSEDLQSASTLEQFMSRLCLHHQRQIVDALGFLQSEVKTVAGSNHLQTLSPILSEKPATTSCNRVIRPETQRSGRTFCLDTGVCLTRPQDSTVVMSSQRSVGEDTDVSSVACVTSEEPVDLCNMDVLLPLSSCEAVVECGNVSSPTKSDHLEAKRLLDSSIKQVFRSDSVKKCLCSAEQCLPTCTAKSDQAELVSKHTHSIAQNEDAFVNPSAIQKTSNVVTQISPRTARKSRKGSCPRPRIIIDPDSNCDLVYIRKSITECQAHSRSRLHPRQNARKSTRGHRYVEECLELKTVRTQARKSICDSTGNCPARLPNMPTLVTPKQMLPWQSGSVPLVNAPFAGDCMKSLIQKLSSRQIAEDEMPGDVVKVTGVSLTVEASQTDKNEVSHEPSCEIINLPDVITEAPRCTLNAVEQEENMDVDKTTECAVQKEGCNSQIAPMAEEVLFGAKSTFEDESLEQSLTPECPETAKERSTDKADVEQSNQRGTESTTEDETATIVQKQPEESETKADTEEDPHAQEQDLRDTESNLQTVNSSNLPTQWDSEGSSLTVSTVQPLGNCKKDMDAHTPKVLNAKQPVPSDRCLRSRVSKGSIDVMKDSVKCVDQVDDMSQKTQSAEANVHTEDKHDLDILETGQGLSLGVDHTVEVKPATKTTPALGKDEKASSGVNVNDEVSPVVLPEHTTTESGKPHRLNNEASESTDKIPLRNKNSPVKVSVSGECSLVKKASPNSENMHLRSRINTERPFSSKSIIQTEGHSEKQGENPSMGNGSEQSSGRDLCSSSEAVTRMPLRNRTVNTTKLTVTTESSVQDSVKSLTSEQPVSTSCKKTDDSGHMPLRSSASVASDQPSNSRSALDSPGRMSLRRGTALNMDSATSPSKTKRPLRLPKVSVSSSGEAEEKPVSSKLKVQHQKHMEPQIRDSLNLSDGSLQITSLQKPEPAVCSPPKFLQALQGEEHQQLISNLNTKFDKMHKGWVQMDKEGQPAPKPKNKADRLKEIWKSKRRVRKSRPLEQQRFSPVQMLFMKPFDLPSICRWFLQSTETKSLVIVKKVNTRLPSETQLCFHTSAAGAGTAHGIFPSLQAERLKKHLKKFAIASPVKNNPKNQRLLSKALGQGLSSMRSREKHEPTTATRICTKAQSLAGVSPAPSESLGAIAGSGKNPARARILRKYSNMREKRQVQQNKNCKEKTFKGARLKAALHPKKVTKQKLQTCKGPKSVVVQRISSLTKTTKANSALKARVLKRNNCHKDRAGPKSLQGLKRLSKAEHGSSNSPRKTLVRSGAEKTQPIKASGTKAELKKTVLQKGPHSLEPQSLDVDSKPLTLEDQVLTRSQRKMEGIPAQTGSPKATTKRSSEPLVTPTKRTRTSKP